MKLFGWERKSIILFRKHAGFSFENDYSEVKKFNRFVAKRSKADVLYTLSHKPVFARTYFKN